MAGLKTVVELLQDLVAIPSVNPEGNPGTDRTGEQAIADYVADFLRTCGAEVQVRHIAIGRPNVIATFTPSQPAAHLAFAPHLDTVSVAGMTIDPFNPVVRNNCVYGRGSSDTKGPMAAALWALHDWAHSAARKDSRVTWTFLGLMGEEATNEGAMAVASHGFSCDLAMALEPTGLGVVTAHKGALWLEVTTSGVAGHGSMPDKGKSAIYAMRRVLEHLETATIPALARTSHPALGASTLNVGTIAGGSKINIVPDACRIEVDCRVVPGVDGEQFRAQLEAELRAVVPEASVRLVRYAPPLATDEKLPWVARLGAAAKGLTTAPWFSDASYLSGPHCPAVCIGPGSIAQAHTKDEFISLRDLEEGAHFFRRWIDVAEKAAHER
jgi:acetylornithine deacetylase/succinyl-diaminopimelate desuccinylase-like protein